MQALLTAALALTALATAAIGCGDDDDSSDGGDKFQTGTYEGTVRCEGSDDFSNGQKRWCSTPLRRHA